MDGHVIHVAPSSLYGQVTDDLLNRILDGQFKPGDILPTEGELCRQYGVSRITIRRAVSDLVARRLVVRKRGVGSFVTGRPAALREFHLTGFLDDKLAFDSRAVLNRAEHADADVARALALEEGAVVRHIRTLVHRDGEPFTVADAYTADLPDRRVQEVDCRDAAPSAYALGRRLGRRIERAEQELDAVAADRILAGHLGLTRGTPVVRARRVYYSAGDQPIQYLVVRYHPSRYRFVVDLMPRTGASAFAEAGDMRPGSKVSGGKKRRNKP